MCRSIWCAGVLIARSTSCTTGRPSCSAHSMSFLDARMRQPLLQELRTESRTRSRLRLTSCWRWWAKCVPSELKAARSPTLTSSRLGIRSCLGRRPMVSNLIWHPVIRRTTLQPVPLVLPKLAHSLCSLTQAPQPRMGGHQRRPHHKHQTWTARTHTLRSKIHRCSTVRLPWVAKAIEVAASAVVAARGSGGSQSSLATAPEVPDMDQIPRARGKPSNGLALLMARISTFKWQGFLVQVSLGQHLT
mmetsp:Transcript_113487/g.316047  ORF Transcript_113487/g.316047 Transcript_113487/m.316047 type:complete len:246 (+) Transcript_113487:959-1696(+)